MENNPNSLLKTIWVKIDGRSCLKQLDDIGNGSRKYPSMRINEISFWELESIDVFATSALHVKHLELHSVKFRDAEKFIKFLKKFQNLSSLKIFRNSIIEFSLYRTQLNDIHLLLESENLLNLKLSSLQFERDDERDVVYNHRRYKMDSDNFMKLFYQMNLQCKKIFLADFFVSDSTLLSDFLKKQQNLKQLSIDFPKLRDADDTRNIQQSEVFKALNEGNYTSTGFEKLSVDFKEEIRDEAEISNFLTFLRKHRETLKELKITTEENSFIRISLGILLFLHQNLKLEKLYLFRAPRNSNSPEFYTAMNCDIPPIVPNLHLKLLHLKNITIKHPIDLFTAFPSIEKLHLDGIENVQHFSVSSIFAAPKYLKSLKCLQVPKLPMQIGDGSRMCISSLKSVHINYLHFFPGSHDKNDEFLRFNPSIEQLTIEDRKDVSYVKVLKLLTRNNLINLEKLFIGNITYGIRKPILLFEEKPTEDSELMRKQLNEVCEVCPKLRLIEICHYIRKSKSTAPTKITIKSFYHKKIQIMTTDKFVVIT